MVLCFLTNSQRVTKILSNVKNFDDDFLIISQMMKQF